MSQATGPEDPSLPGQLPDETVAQPPPQPGPAQAPPRPDQGKLERQTVVMINDRGRLALLVGLCTLAGVAVGFGLSTMIAQSGSACSHNALPASSSRTSRTYVETVIPRPRVVVPRIGGFGLHCHHEHCWVDGNGWRVQLGDLDLEALSGIGRLFDDDDDTAWLGVNIVTSDAGARVTDVSDGSPAERAGLRQDDVIVEFEGRRVGSASQLVRLVRSADPGDEVKMKIERGDQDDAQTSSVEAELSQAPRRHRHGRSR